MRDEITAERFSTRCLYWRGAILVPEYVTWAGETRYVLPGGALVKEKDLPGAQAITHMLWKRANADRR